MHAKEENNSLFEEQFYCLEWKRALWISELRHTQFAFFNNENVKHSIEPGKESTFSTRRHSTRREERRWMRHQPPLASLFPKLYSCLTNGELSQVGNGHWRGDSPLICSITFHLFSLVCCIGTSELFPLSCEVICVWNGGLKHFQLCHTWPFQSCFKTYQSKSKRLQVHISRDEIVFLSVKWELERRNNLLQSYFKISW